MLMKSNEHKMPANFRTTNMLRYFIEGFNITQRKLPRKLKKKLKKRGVYITQRNLNALWQEFKEEIILNDKCRKTGK